MKNTGAINLGGSVATAGGVVFIAAAADGKFRAFESRTGKQLWVTKLDSVGNATPITLIAFALP
jgi:glucose dehydrogenase